MKKNKKFNAIDCFYIDKAQYKIFDKTGNYLVLEIDYWGNKYKIQVVSGNGLVEKVKKEAETKASDMLKRKSRVNFAVKN